MTWGQVMGYIFAPDINDKPAKLKFKSLAEARAKATEINESKGK